MAEADIDDLIEIIEKEGNVEEIPEVIPMMPVRDVVVFTDMLLPLFVGREKSIKAIEECVEYDRYVFLTVQKDSEMEKPGPSDVYDIGTIARVQKMIKMPDGRIKALVQGISKARLIEFVQKRSFFKVKVEAIFDVEPDSLDIEIEALMRNVKENSEKLLALKGEFSGDVGDLLSHIDSPGKLADLVASNLNLKVEDAQAILETTDTVERLTRVNDLLARELDLSTVQAKIQTMLKTKFQKTRGIITFASRSRLFTESLGKAMISLPRSLNSNKK